jgi:hypothetical protein
VAVLTGNGIQSLGARGAEGQFGGSLSLGHRNSILGRRIEGNLRCGGLGSRRAATALENGTDAAAQERTEGPLRRRRSRHSTVER